MGKVYTSVDQLVGNTPLVELTKIEAKYGLKAKIFAKLFMTFSLLKKNAARVEPRLVEYIGLEPTTYRLRTYRSTR